MSKITLDNLSDNLKAYLEGLGLSEEQVLNLINENGLDEEELKAMLKDTMSINELSTNSKTIIGAINELFQSANNGKELIASAIGEPVSSDDTFQAMSTDINSLLSTFKTNMMNNGIAVESEDKFKSLIDKIATLADSEGKGIKFASGDFTLNVPNNGSIGSNTTGQVTQTVTFDKALDFEWTYFFIGPFNLGGSGSGNQYGNNLYLCGLKNPISTFLSGNGRGTVSAIEFSSTGFTLAFNGGYSTYLYVWNNEENIQWYAIGVGEEDTTLRDSLASILQEEGVGVTEEDDMASLITKVDEEFDEKNNSKVEIEFSFEDMVELQYKGLDSEGYGFTASVWGIKTSAIGFKPSHMYIYSLQQPYQGYLWMNYNSMDDGTETMICTNIGNWFDWVFINITFTHNQGYKDIIVEPNNFGIPVYQYGGGTATKPSAGYKFKLVAYK